MNAKILLIDDDKLILKLLKKELGDAGYEVKTAEGGVDGFEKFKSGSYDLLITDYMMPDIDGIELMQKVKAIDPDFPVIIFTAYGTVKNATDALRLGAVDYIEKPALSEFNYSLYKIVKRMNFFLWLRCVDA